MRLSHLHSGGKGMHDHLNGGFFIAAHGDDTLRSLQASSAEGAPFFPGGALACTPAALILHSLTVNMVQGLGHGRDHFRGLRCPHDRMIAYSNRDLSFMTVFFDCQDHVRIKIVAQEFANLGEAMFDLLADDGSNFILSAGVLNVHRTPSL